MDIADYLERANEVLRSAVHYALEKGLITKTALASKAGIDARVLGPYAAAERDLQLNDMTKLGRALDQHIRTSDVSDLPAPLATLLDVEKGQGSAGKKNHVGVETTEFGQQLCNGLLTGGDDQFRQLEGNYFILRRNRTDNLVIVTALSITFDETARVCKWINRHKSLTGAVKNVHGIVTFYGGVFYFAGFLEKTSILHALSAVQAPGEWDHFSGVLLSMQATTPMASRAVMVRTAIAFEDAETYCGQIADKDIHRFKITNLEYLNNACPANGILFPFKDF